MGGKKSRIENQIKDARTAMALSQVKLAEQVGVTRQTIIAMEQGRYSPSLELAFRLSHILQTPIEELFQFTGEWD
jgi:putative transcriptional regulator